MVLSRVRGSSLYALLFAILSGLLAPLSYVQAQLTPGTILLVDFEAGTRVESLAVEPTGAILLVDTDALSPVSRLASGVLVRIQPTTG
ncbi:MAG: hypothetical protein FJZ47_10795 [Candidatus Tectomicrobia bacterium]|uniref:Uncharacterized protein n=1 Tax=Tectimicrobiota bacterium TaxID=2528274 RepID=A0A938B402_UNCTE|nr:hypothetical protein [Candidatus Tectomicrobia bacterium]